jgi:hypothetical protein
VVICKTSASIGLPWNPFSSFPSWCPNICTRTKGYYFGPHLYTNLFRQKPPIARFVDANNHFINDNVLFGVTNLRLEDSTHVLAKIGFHIMHRMHKTIETMIASCIENKLYRSILLIRLPQREMINPLWDSGDVEKTLRKRYFLPSNIELVETRWCEAMHNIPYFHHQHYFHCPISISPYSVLSRVYSQSHFSPTTINSLQGYPLKRRSTWHTPHGSRPCPEKLHYSLHVAVNSKKRTGQAGFARDPCATERRLTQAVEKGGMGRHRCRIYSVKIRINNVNYAKRLTRLRGKLHQINS